MHLRRPGRTTDGHANIHGPNEREFEQAVIAETDSFREFAIRAGVAVGAPRARLSKTAETARGPNER